MAQTVRLPDGRTASFPDEATPDQIQSALLETFPQFKPTEPDPGYLGDTWRGLKHGVEVTLPESTGKALKFFGAEDTGQGLIDYAKSNDTPDLQESAVGRAHDKWYSPRGNVYEAGDNAVLSMAPGAAGAAIGAGIGSVVPGIGTAVGALAGYGIGSIASLPIFYGSQAQESYEAVLKHQREIGTPEDEAQRIARSTAHAEGSIEAGGELVQDAIPFAKLFKTFGKPVAKAVVSGVLKPTLIGAAKTVGQVVGGEVATEMAQQAGEDWARKAIGDTGEGATWGETAKVIMPTALMSVVPGGAGAGAHHYKRTVALNALASPETDPDMRARIAVGAATAMADGNEDISRAFAKYASDQIEAKAAIEIKDDDQFYLQYKLSAAKTGTEAIAAAEAALAAPVDALTPAIAVFQSNFDANRVPADSAVQPIGVDLQGPPAPTPAIALLTDTVPATGPLVGPLTLTSEQIVATADRLNGMPVGAQTQELLALPRADRQAVVRAMHPSGIVTPTVLDAGQGQAGQILNEATTAASSVQPTLAVSTGVPAYTQRAAQEIVSKDPSQEMRPHRDVPNRFEVVPKMSTEQTTNARAMPPTLSVSPTQQQLAEQEATGVPAAPAMRPVVPAKPLTAAQIELNRMAADAERSSLPRRSIFRNSQLRDVDAPDIKGEKVTHNMRRFLTQIGKLTGTKVVFEFAPEDSEGAVPVRGENVIHINTAAQINPLQVMGHEVTHVLKDRHREAWVSIRDALVATMPDKRKALDAFAEDYWHTHPDRLEAARAMPDWSQKLTPEQMKQFNSGENTIDAFLLDEMTSDLGGSHWSSEQFWTDVFAKIEAKHGSEKAKGIIQRLVASIKEALNKFLMVVRAQKQGDYTTVTPEQLTATRDAVTSAYAKFINEERTATPEYGTNTLDRRIRTSDVTSRSQGAEPAPARQQAAPETGSIDDLEAARENELSQLSPQRKDQRLFFEVAPNPKDSTAVAAWQQRTDKEKQTVSNDVVERIIPGLLRDIGVTGKVVTQLGGWKAHTNPSFALVVTRGDAALAARAIGYVLDQEAVYAMGLTPFTGSTKTGIIHFDLGGKKAHDIYKQVRELARAVITGHSTVGNEMLIGLAVAQMDRFESAIVAIARKNDVAVRFDEGYGAIIGEKDYDIQHRQGNTSGQHTAEGRIADWRTKARAVFAGQSDAGGNERNGSIAPETDRRKERSVSAVGIHYSRAQRDYLSSSAYGTGLRGAEAERVAQSDDPRIKHRIYFYVNSGRGIRPEQGVGAHAHRASLTNLYDQNADPLNLTLGRDANEFESSVLDAGFNGYVTHDAGMAVLLGPRTAHVEYVGKDNSPAVPVAEKATPSTYRSQLASLAARKDLPSGKMSGADWKRMVKDIDVSHLTDTDAYYKDQLVQPPVARMSEQRPPSWYYSPLTRAAESATMKTAPASGWKDWLKSLPAKGVKPDEIKWSGIEEWLDVQGKQPVTKQQVQSFLSDFGIKVETILRGERNPKSSAVVSQDIDADEEPAEIHISFGEWETEEPDEDYLHERAKEQLDEEIDNRVDIEGGYIADDIRRYNFMQIEVKVLNIVADARQQMGEMFPVDETQVEQYARSIAAAQVAGDTWQEYADEDADLTDEDVQVEATDRAFAVLSGDMTALDTEVERRARAAIDEDKLLEDLVERERQYYYDDYDAPQTRTIHADGVDDVFYHYSRYGDQTLTYRGNDIRLPRNADDADIEGAIYSYLADEGLSPDVVSTSTDGTGFVPTKWDGYITDERRAVPGSYREVQLTLPPGTHGEVKSRSNPVGDSRGEAGAITERADAKDFIYTVHWNEKNVVGHARFDEHIDENGKRVMVLQEIQGDWGQQRREGVDAQAEVDRLYPLVVEKRGQVADVRKALESLLPDTAGWKTTDWVNVERLGSRGLAATANNDVGVAADKLMKVDEQLRELERNLNQVESEASNIPAVAPFIEKTVQWSGLVMKRMIAHAIEYGFDKVVWTSGAQQVERWKGSLRKEVDTIAWEKTPEGIHIVASKNGKVRSDTRLAETVLSDHIGKAMAKQIISDPNQSGEITGDDITISDTGMAGFYDRMLPNVTNDILKKLDKSVRVHDIEVHPVDKIDTASTPNGWVVLRNGRDDSPFFDTESKAAALKEKIEAAQTRAAITIQQGFEITDKLRESAANGLPLMSERRRAAADRKANDRRAWYYSQLSVAVNEIPRKIKTGKEAALWLQSNAAKLGVKKDELQWSGVLDWLAAQPTPAGVNDWLRDNGVHVREVVLGEESPEYLRLDAEFQEMDVKVDQLRDELVGVGIPRVPNLAASNVAKGDENTINELKRLNFSQRQLDAMMEYGRALNRKNELFEQRKAARGDPVKYNTPDLTLPGGIRYRELLLTLPTATRTERDAAQLKLRAAQDRWLEDNGEEASAATEVAEREFDAAQAKYKAQTFRSSHFPQPNILAHLRFDERTDANGKRVLFIEEVQSDWAQRGRREGFAQPQFTVIVDGNQRGQFNSRAEAETAIREKPLLAGGKVREVEPKGPPLAPFVTDTKAWTALALKRAIAYAVDNGFDRVAYTTGEQQADRYDLSEQVSRITVNWYKAENDTVMLKAYGLDGEPVIIKNEIPRSEMDKYIGKEAAKKADEQLREYGRVNLTGLDLKIGGEGMRGFYDQIVPQVARSLGATMGTVQLGMRLTTAQPGFDITDKMKEQARIGMPLFSTQRGSSNLERWAGDTIVRNANGSLKRMYHGTARDISTFRPQQADAIFLTDDPEFAANFADMSHSWMVNNYWTWMTPDQIQQAKRDAMRLLLKDALPGSSLYMREERLFNQSQQPSQYMRRAVEQYMPSESNIMPLYVRAENPFDYRNPEHVAAIEAEIGTSWLGQEAINGEMHEVSQHIGDLERGDWNAIESPQVQAYIRQHHDSFYVRERGVTNLAVFSPNQVKSAIGNNGAYSREDNDIRQSTPRSRMTGQPINQSWTDPNVTDWDDLVRKMQDDKIDTKRVLRAIRDAGMAVKTKFDAYLLETNYHGRAAARVDEFANGELRKLLEDMAMRKLSMQDLDDYLWARHAPERNAANNRSNPAITDGSGMSDAQSAAILAGQAVTVGTRAIQLSAAALRGAAAVSSRVDAITKGTLDLLVSSGLETQQTVDTWRRTYKSYAPLKRDMESDANYSGAFGLGNGTGTGFSVRGAASRRALGSKRAVTDVLANIAMQRERAITRSEKNRIAQAVYGLALSAPNPEFWIPVNTELNKRLTPAALAKVIAELVGIGVNPIDAQNLAREPVQRYIDPKTGLEMQRINPSLRGREDVLTTRINGKDRYVFFSNKKRAQEMVRGLKNLDAAQVSGVLQFIAPVTRWFASINTQYNPIFGLTNGIRDFGTGMLNLSSTDIADRRTNVAREAFAALRGVYADLRDHRAGRVPTSQWAQLFEQFAMDGGQTGYRDAFATSADRAQAIAEELKHAGKGQNWLAVGEKRSHIFGWLSDYNTAVENAMRLASYKVYLDKYLRPGMSAQEQQDVRDKAAFTAKNLTVNFNKKGLAATQTGALYAFFNASVQGTARIAETTLKDGKLTDAGKKIVYGGIMLGVLQAILGAAAGWDDDEPPQFSREKNFIIPIPGSDKYVSIPMPLGFHVLPNIGRIAAEWMMSGFKDPGKRITRMAGMLLDSFNPIGSGTLAQTLSPTIGDPIVALSENKDWTGKSIYKEDFDKLHPTAGWTRSKDTASPPARWFSRAINYITGGGTYNIGMLSPTPDTLDYLISQATGGTGRELLKVAQYTSAKVSGEELPMHKVPFGVGRFIGETKGQSSEVSRFYGNLQRIGEHKSALDEMKHAGDGAAISAYLTENPDARMIQVADKAQHEIAYLRRQKRNVLEKGGNAERVKMLDERITATASRYNQVLRGK